MLVVLLKNGGTTVETINSGASGGQFYSSSTYSGPITSLVISRTSRAPEFNAIGINGIILKDDSTTNLDFGTNGFYLPMDGNSPIGQDKSGNNNDWTPMNLGGGRVADLDESTGGLPILNTIQGGTQAGVGVRTDAESANLALPLLGDKEDVSHLINGESTKKTITNNGVNISNADSNFYNGSFYWDGGTTDRLTVDYSSEFQFGTGDFCVEFWVNLSTSSGNQYFWDFNQNGGNFQYNGNVLSYSDGVIAGSGPLYSTGITLPIGKWVHLAVTREGSTGRIFVNGEMRATGTTDYDYNQTTVLDIGNGYNNSGYEITGYMQDFRIYKGVAKYTSDFVVTLTDPEVVLDTPSGVSGGSKLTKITDGAVSFDSSGDYLTIGDSIDFAFGTGDFTECFIYPKGNVNYRAIIDCRDQVSDPGGWILGVNDGINSTSIQMVFS